MNKHREYIECLIECLKETSFTYGQGQATVSYESGIELLVEVFLKAKRDEKKVFFIGNGGSAAIASHMTADFMKNGRIKTCSLYDSATITCFGNDYGYEFVFANNLEFMLDEDDVLVAISSSGNSQNIINAIEVARAKRARIITLSGFERGNKIRQMGDYNVYVGIRQYGIVESIHNLILQQIVDSILERGV